MNITLPADIAESLGKKPNKSAYIAAAVREKLAADEEARRRTELAKAYREAAAEERELLAEWDALAGDALA